MFELIFSLIILILLTFINGTFFSRYILAKDAVYLEVYEIGLIGIIFLTTASYLIHLLLPLNLIVNSLFFFLITIFTINYHLKDLKFLTKQNYIILSISFFVVILMTLKYRPNEDYGYYHLPYLINIISEKVIFGLANLQVNFAWNSSWLNFTSLFNLPFLELKGTQLANSVLFFFVLLMFLNEINKKENYNKISFYFILFLSSYILIKFSRLSEHGFDFPANISLMICFYYFLKIYEENKINLICKNFTFLLVFSTYCLTIKLSTFISPLLVFFAFLYIYKKINLNLIYRPIIFCLVLFILWSSQQFIYSGCFFPFFEFSCIESVPWYVENITNSVSNATGAVNKSFSQYEGSLSKDEYIKNFNWLPTWFERNKIELLEHFLAMIVPLIILILFFFKKKTLNEKKIILNYSLLVPLFLIVLTGILIWLIKSPVIRFGVPYLFLLTFLIIYFVFLRFVKFDISLVIKLILIISITFNLFKNYKRINKINTTNVWPIILDLKYSQKKNGDFIINYPDDKTDNYHKRKYCWSIPFICHMNGGTNLKFRKEYNYLFISKN